MNWVQEHEKKDIFKTTIDTLKNSPNSLCENHNPSTSFFADATNDFDKTLINELNDNNNNKKSNSNNNNNCFKEMPLFENSTETFDQKVTNVESLIYSIKQFFSNVSTTDSFIDHSATINNDLLAAKVLSNLPNVDISNTTVSISNINTKNLSSSLTKRRRPRRNPVWQYFRVENYLAVCKHCNYNTKSIFSTNLKVHLKSHHRKLFDLVLNAEKAMEISSKNAANAVKVLKTCPSNNAFTAKNLKTSENLLNLSNLIQDTKVKQNDKTKSYNNNEIFFNNNNYLQNEQDSFTKFFNKTTEKDQAISNTSNIVNINEYLQNLLPTADSKTQIKQNAVVLSPTNLQSNSLEKNSSTKISPFSSNTENTPTISNLNDPITNLLNSLVDENDYSPCKKLNIIDNETASNSCELHEDKSSIKISNSNNTNLVHNTVDMSFFKNTENLNEKFKQRRRRLRRHPVWNFFKDVEDKIVGCIMCNFRTTSAFSTNLKMHLKAHHKEQFIQVLQTEQDQLGNNCDFKKNKNCFVTSATHFCQRTGRLKRRRKTAEEIQEIIDKCKTNLIKERQKRINLNLDTNDVTSNIIPTYNFDDKANLSDLWKALYFRKNNINKPIKKSDTSYIKTTNNESSFDASNENLKVKTDDESELTFFKQLNAIIELICLNNNNSINNNNIVLLNNNFSQTSSDNDIKLDDNFTNNIIDENNSHLVEKLKTELKLNINKNNNNNENDESSYDKNSINLNDLTRKILFNSIKLNASLCTNFNNVLSTKSDKIHTFFEEANYAENKTIRTTLINKGLDIAIAKIIEHLGSSIILRVPEFKSIILMISPDYDYTSVMEMMFPKQEL